jgi:RNA polymerase I-specific transcription initiation factor RRN3
LSNPPDTVDPEDPLSYLNQDLDWGDKTKRILSCNVKSKLNPLKVCTPGIVEEFAKLAHKLSLVYVYPVLEINKRVRLSQYIKSSYSAGGRLRDIGNEAARDEDSLQLDPYFPFDPYQLPGSKRWLEGDYIGWEPIPGLNADEEDEYDSDGSDAEIDEFEQILMEEETATDSEEDEDED